MCMDGPLSVRRFPIAVCERAGSGEDTTLRNRPASRCRATLLFDEITIKGCMRNNTWANMRHTKLDHVDPLLPTNCYVFGSQ